MTIIADPWEAYMFVKRCEIPKTWVQISFSSPPGENDLKLWVSVSLVIYHKRVLQCLNGYKSSIWHQNHIVHRTFLAVLEVITHQGISYFNWLHKSIMPDCSTYSMCYFFRNKHTTSKLENNQKFKISSFPWLQLQ